tara:strand:+ start:871 stop:1926 length:1056 start_codon:yes stop_codon:yes gene_type:complete
MNIKFGKTLIGNNKKSFVIAEMSGNHNSSLSKAMKIILAAKKCGACAIKLQTYTADTITIKSNKKDFLIPKNSPWSKKKNLWNLYNYAHTPWAWHKKLFDYANKIGIEIFSSPFDDSAVDLLESLNCKAYKIASSEINHIPLLERVAKTKKPIFLSTGLASYKDIDLAIKTLRKKKVKKIILLICKSNYPAKVEEYNLKLIKLFKKKYNIIIGLSDHTLGNSLAISSLTLGARVFEKHFKLNNQKDSVDSFFSQNESDFKKYISEIREVEAALNYSKKVDSNGSKKMRSIYVSKKILKNEKITNQNIKISRPGLSLHPKYFSKIIGLKVNRSLNLGDRLSLKFINGLIKLK